MRNPLGIKWPNEVGKEASMNSSKGGEMSILRKLKVILGFGKIPDVCVMSKGRFDFHDYPKNKGGDGYPSHFYTYKCWNCGKEFTI
jgi:hypothetical protein